MKQIIPFKKELPFKTKVSEITSISLERELHIEEEGVITGVFHITGDYKMNEGSINRENFSFDLPFDITLDPRYDVSTVVSDIEDFYYDVENEDTLKVNIDLYVEADYLEDTKETVLDSHQEDKEEEERETISEEREEAYTEEEKKEVEEPAFEEVTITEKLEDREDREEIEDDREVKEEEDVKEEVVEVSKPDTAPLKEERETSLNIGPDLFSNLDDTETYSTYYVYIVKEEDTIDKILAKYKVTKEDLEAYNDISEIKPGDKIIVPQTTTQ